MDDVEEGAAAHNLVLPEDGYEWKKYGQKFIKSVGKYRSYFKCKKSNCEAKKQAEWSPFEANKVRVHYDGSHNHALLKIDDEPGSSGSNVNHYNLYTQVFGNKANTQA